MRPRRTLPLPCFYLLRRAPPAPGTSDSDHNQTLIHISTGHHTFCPLGLGLPDSVFLAPPLLDGLVDAELLELLGRDLVSIMERLARYETVFENSERARPYEYLGVPTYLGKRVEICALALLEFSNTRDSYRFPTIFSWLGNARRICIRKSTESS